MKSISMKTLIFVEVDLFSNQDNKKKNRKNKIANQL